MARLGRGQPNRPIVVRVKTATTPHGDLTVTGNADVTLTGTAARFGDLTVTGNADVTISGSQQTGIGLPPRPRTRWQLVIGPASGGHELALTEATDRKYTARLGDNSDLSFSIDGRHPQAEGIAELSTDVHLLFTDTNGTTILDRCRIGQTGDDIDENSHKVTVTCLDYRAVLAARRLYSDATLTYTATDQAEIAWTLVEYTQGKTGGNLGIAKGWVGTLPTNVLRNDRTYEAGDSVGDRIKELAELIDGFDWDITPTSASGLRMDVWYPQRGSDRGVVLILGGLAQEVHREPSTAAYANALRYTGAAGDDVTPGPTAVESEATDLASADAFPEGRWDAAFGDDGLTTQAQLDERAAWQLEQSQVGAVAYTVKLQRGAWDGPDHIWLGDTVRLIIPSGRLAVDTAARVHEVAVDMDGNNGETVTLTLGGPRPDFTRWPSAIEKRLKNLERR